MGNVTQFPGTTKPPSSDDQAQRERDHDVLYVRDALRSALPAEALAHIDGIALLRAARAAVAAADEARHRRRFEADYDERRTEGELGALNRLWLGDDQPFPGGAA